MHSCSALRKALYLRDQLLLVNRVGSKLQFPYCWRARRECTRNIHECRDEIDGPPDLAEQIEGGAALQCVARSMASGNSAPSSTASFTATGKCFCAHHNTMIMTLRKRTCDGGEALRRRLKAAAFSRLMRMELRIDKTFLF